VLDGALLVTGEVDRTIQFESGMPGHQALRGGEWKPDPLILDDQAILLNVRDKGFVVLTRCGHASIVNTVRYAKKLTGIEEVYAIIGGFHLIGPAFEPPIPETCDALAAFSPQVFVPPIARATVPFTSWPPNCPTPSYRAGWEHGSSCGARPCGPTTFPGAVRIMSKDVA